MPLRPRPLPRPLDAERLLRKLATDPGVVRVMVEHEFVVGALCEMDPEDGALRRRLGLEQQGACTLGYNENAGARIHMRLRDDALRAMRPYRELVNTVSSSARANWS